ATRIVDTSDDQSRHANFLKGTLGHSLRARGKLHTILHSPRLIRRGEYQRARVEILRLRAAREALADIPQFPPGTAVALVRQVLLIDNEAHLVPSNTTEAVQFRMCDIGGSPSPDRNAAKRFQDFFEFRLRRERLFVGKDGGVHAVGDSETEF